MNSRDLRNYMSLRRFIYLNDQNKEHQFFPLLKSETTGVHHIIEVTWFLRGRNFQEAENTASNHFFGNILGIFPSTVLICMSLFSKYYNTKKEGEAVWTLNLLLCSISTLQPTQFLK